MTIESVRLGFLSSVIISCASMTVMSIKEKLVAITPRAQRVHRRDRPSDIIKDVPIRSLMGLKFLSI